MVKNVLKKNEKRRKNNKGFSLVELIVVIAIMAVLVGVLAPQLIKYVEKSREATDIQNADSIVSSIKTYYSDKDDAPASVTVYLEKTGVTTEAAITDAGLASTKLKGTGWNNNMIAITVDLQNGEAKYTCGSKYYEADGKSTISAKTDSKESTIKPTKSSTGASES